MATTASLGTDPISSLCIPYIVLSQNPVRPRYSKWRFLKHYETWRVNAPPIFPDLARNGR
jgi:hypothetical protein